MKENLIQQKTFSFSLKIIKLCMYMSHNNEYVLSRQLLKSGTSIGANVEEVLAGSSKRDFTAKMSIAAKEARETHYWLRLIKNSNIITYDLDDLLMEIEEIINILYAIVKTTQRKYQL